MIVSPLAESRAKFLPASPYLCMHLTRSPGVFANVFQNKGDTGGMMRICLDRKELMEVCRRTRQQCAAARRKKPES